MQYVCLGFNLLFNWNTKIEILKYIRNHFRNI